MVKVGKITESPECNVRDHERRTAKALAKAGISVEFVPPSDKNSAKSPDVVIAGRYWEMKSPITAKMAQIEKNLKRASKQSENVIIDSQRVKFIPDQKLQKFLVEKLGTQKSIKRLLFVNRQREVIDINKVA